MLYLPLSLSLLQLRLYKKISHVSDRTLCEGKWTDGNIVFVSYFD